MTTTVSKDNNGKFVLDNLSSDDIAELMAGGRVKGEYERYLDTFVATGDEYDVITRNVMFAKKDAGSVLNSLKQNIVKHTREKNWPPLSAMKREVNGEDHVFVVNLQVHAAALAAASTEAS